VIESDFFVIRVITNKELNERCRLKCQNQQNVTVDGAKHELLKEAHIQVLNCLYKKHPGATIVVDDFMDTQKKPQQGIDFKKELEQNIVGEAFGKEQVSTYLTTEGDAKITAIGLASDISYYISNLGYEYAQETYNGISKTNLNLPTGASGFKEITGMLKNVNEDKVNQFVDAFSKEYYEYSPDGEKAKMSIKEMADKLNVIQFSEKGTTKKTNKFYAVAVGKKTGIFHSYEECQEQVKGYPKAKFKSFSSEIEAQCWLEENVLK